MMMRRAVGSPRTAGVPDGGREAFSSSPMENVASSLSDLWGPGVNFRTWWPDQQILGLWSNEADANTWAYAAVRGWLKLDGSIVTTHQAMLSELAAAKAGSRPVGLFEDSGAVHQLYA